MDFQRYNKTETEHCEKLLKERDDLKRKRMEIDEKLNDLDNQLFEFELEVRKKIYLKHCEESFTRVATTYKKKYLTKRNKVQQEAFEHLEYLKKCEVTTASQEEQIYFSKNLDEIEKEDFITQEYLKDEIEFVESMENPHHRKLLLDVELVEILKKKNNSQ